MEARFFAICGVLLGEGLSSSISSDGSYIGKDVSRAMRGTPIPIPKLSALLGDIGLFTVSVWLSLAELRWRECEFCFFFFLRDSRRNQQAPNTYLYNFQ